MRIRNVVLAGHVPMSTGMQAPKDLAGPAWEVNVLEDHFPWVHIKHSSGRTGMTTIFNIVGRAVEPLDEEKLKAQLAPAGTQTALVDATKQASPAKRGG